MAITSQPGPLHPALQYMGALDQVIVKQEVALLEVILPYEVGNKYSIFNTMNQRIFYAAEDSNWCCKQCCGPHRPFAMKITDNMGQPVLHIERPCNMGAFFPNWPCCSDSVIVNAETGDHFGTIERKCNPFFPGYRVLDHNQAQVMSMDGPCCCLLLLAAMCCQDQAFTVVNSDGEEIGQVKKQFSGLLKEMFTDADVFSASFPIDLDIRMKAVLLSSVFLIDFNFYEDPREDKGVVTQTAVNM
ncbi:phospholipid scramblase 2-like isoform X1 [Littorina saxatilis]|uniref:Phospholipid scramblase n=1 Tax=Littorina saxatilis TaxID=31220 RepID=A0AAN9AU76_9CAEN